MAQQRTVRLPALTTEMATAELLAWLVEPGAEVREGDPLVEVTTDKVDMELESPYSGTVGDLLVDAGSVLDVGAALTTITTDDAAEDLLGDLPTAGDGDGDSAPAADAAAGTDGTDASAAAANGEGPGEGTDHGTDPTAEDGRPDAASDADADAGIVPAPPAVRARAREAGVELADLPRSGSRGQVTMADLEAHVADRDAAASTATAPPPPPPSVGQRPSRPAPPPPRPGGGRGDRRAQVRAATARSTTRSQAVPQFTLFRTADLTERATRRGRVSWTTVVARSLAATLWRHPDLNATWDEEHEVVVPRDTVRIGMAVDTPAGLVVVSLDDPDAVAPEAADAALRDAAARARDGKLRPEDMQAASATVSNLGGFGVERFTALLVPPQAAILSVGGVTEGPAVVDGAVVPRLQLHLGLTLDHRVADGADGARALDTLVRILEDG